jgi:hypothetical protein
MALAEFFDRIYGAVGAHLTISRENLEAKLSGTIVGFAFADSPSETESDIADLSLNLIARLYPNVAVMGPEEAVKRAKQSIRKINPQIDFFDEAPVEFTITTNASLVNSDRIHAAASGWVAVCGPEFHCSNPISNPLACGFAACLACAELFRRVFLDLRGSRTTAVSLLNFDDGTGADLSVPEINVSELYFAGLGAVANGCMWALARLPQLHTTAHLIDHERVEKSNLQRYVLTDRKSVGKWKTTLVEDYLRRNSSISVSSHRALFENFLDQHIDLRIENLCVSVDNVSTRRTAQAVLPRTVFNGWTGEGSLGASWHRMSLPSACLACLYHPHGIGVSATEQAARALALSPERAADLWVTRKPLTDDDLVNAAKGLGVELAALRRWRGRTLGELYTDVVCGSAPIDYSVAGQARTEVVPLAHQSVMAGLLLLAEVLKRNSELEQFAQAEPLVAWENVLREPPQIWVRPRAKELGCICQDDDYLDVYGKIWS